MLAKRNTDHSPNTTFNAMIAANPAFIFERSVVNMYGSQKGY